MTNKIKELNQKEINSISGGMSEEMWRYVVEPAITVACYAFLFVASYMKKASEIAAKHAEIAKKK